MDFLSVAGGFLVGGGAVGIGAVAVVALSKMRRLERRIAELEAQAKAAHVPADILAQAQADARNRQLAILAATDLADYVSQNFPGASRDIIQRIAPHLLDKRVG